MKERWEKVRHLASAEEQRHVDWYLSFHPDGLTRRSKCMVDALITRLERELVCTNLIKGIVPADDLLDGLFQVAHKIEEQTLQHQADTLSISSKITVLNQCNDALEQIRSYFRIDKEENLLDALAQKARDFDEHTRNYRELEEMHGKSMDNAISVGLERNALRLELQTVTAHKEHRGQILDRVRDALECEDGESIVKCAEEVMAAADAALTRIEDLELSEAVADSLETSINRMNREEILCLRKRVKGCEELLDIDVEIHRRLHHALTFYANPVNWRGDFLSSSPVERDGGATAFKALNPRWTNVYYGFVSELQRQQLEQVCGIPPRYFAGEDLKKGDLVSILTEPRPKTGTITLQGTNKILDIVFDTLPKYDFYFPDPFDKSMFWGVDTSKLWIYKTRWGIGG